MKNIVCLKWGDKYSADYVNNLYWMVRRNLEPPFRFVCFTDDASGIIDQVECLPIQDPSNDMVGWWHKVSFFKHKLHDLTGMVLYLDLDVVIINDITEMFDQPGEFKIIKDWMLSKAHGKIKFNSSVMRFQVGSQPQIYDGFVKNKHKILQLYPGDQDWITESARNPSQWPDAWCISFKWHKCWQHVPSQAKIIVFHGQPNPPEAIKGFKTFPPAPWIANYWRAE